MDMTNMHSSTRPSAQRQTAWQSQGRWQRHAPLTTHRQLAPTRSARQPQLRRGLLDRSRSAVVVATASRADDFGSRFRRGAASRLKQAAEQLEDSGRRAASSLDRTLHLRDQGRRAQEVVKGGTAWVDKRLRVRKRLQLLAENVRRDLPKWRRQLGKFNDSTVGQLFWVALFVYSIYTGAFFTILFSALRIFFLISWLLPILLVFSMRQFNSQMAAAQAQQRAAAAQQTTRRNPFGGSPFGGSPFTQKGRSGPSAGKPGPDFTQGGPIIDAEFETIDNGDH